MIEISFSIGSNIKDRAAHLEQAIARASIKIGVLKARSSFYETSSWGFDSAPFLNAVIILHTELSPMACLQAGLSIEAEMGRERKAGGYIDRVIDLDILSYGERLISTADLHVPHPRLAERRFVLEPWAEIRPDQEVPGLGHSVQQLLDSCADKGVIERIKNV